MLLKFIMRDVDGAAVAGTPTVTTSSGDTPTPTALSNDWWEATVDAGDGVSCTLAGAVPLDVCMPTPDPAALALQGSLPTGYALEATAQAILTDTGTTLPALIASDDSPPAGYTRITSATYGTLLPGTVVDAYAAADTTYDAPLVPNVTVASNGSWYIDLPDGATYTLVGRLAGKRTATQTVVIA